MIRKSTSGSTFTGGDVSAALTPATDNTLSVGTAAKRFANGHFTTVNTAAVTTPAATAMVATADVANSGSNAAFSFNNTTALTGSTLLARFGSNAVYKVEVEDDGSLVPVTTQGPTLGRSTRVWAGVYSSAYYDTNGSLRIVANGSSHSQYTSRGSNNGSAVAHQFGSATALTNATAKIAGFYSDDNSTIRAYVSYIGGIRPNAANTALPAAGADYRGQIMVIEGGAGVADVFYICQKDAADSYAWKTVTVS